jgi:hypothetical protein
VGEFFNSYAFQSALSALDDEFVAETIDTVLRPLFRDKMSTVTGSPREAVLHFRSGDIFTHPPGSTWYVQPPAAFYTRAFANLQSSFGVERATLVFEDKRNPAVEATLEAMRAAAIPVTLTDGTFDADLSALLGAHHIISSFSTFTEAAAMLSHNLYSYSAFRTLESHAHLHTHRPVPLFAALLRRRGVRTFVLKDADGGFIAPLSWYNTDEQRRLMLDYPADQLSIADAVPPDLAGDRALLAHATDEALTLRRALVAATTPPPIRWNIIRRALRWRRHRRKSSR